jgi:hypothetical protein
MLLVDQFVELLDELDCFEVLASAELLAPRGLLDRQRIPADRERPFRPIVSTDSGDREQPFRAREQEELGHASIELTVGTYGRWLRKKAPGVRGQAGRHESRSDWWQGWWQRPHATYPASGKLLREWI